MQVGFNNDVIYRGEVFHVQTEDGGRKNPVITTTLFKGGMVVASKRTSYEDIIKFERLEEVVREVMREQHLAVIEELQKGAYDALIWGERREREGSGLKGRSMDDIILEYLASEEDGEER